MEAGANDYLVKPYADPELQERVDTLVPYGYADVQISTFHAFGDRLIKENALELGLTPDFRVLTRAEQVIFLRDHLFEFPLRHFRPLGDPTRHVQAMITLFSSVGLWRQQVRPDARVHGIIREGGLVAFPTETVYGLGAERYLAGQAFPQTAFGNDSPLYYTFQIATALEEPREVGLRHAHRFATVFHERGAHAGI